MRMPVHLLLCIVIAQVAAMAQPEAAAYVSLGPKIPAGSTSKATTLETVRVFIVLKNKDTSPLRVITGGKIHLRHGETYLGFSRCEVGFERRQQYSLKGDIVVHAESELAIVTIRQGECALIEGDVKIPFPIEAENISVFYKIDKAIGERYDAWSGEIQIRPVRLPLGQPNGVSP